VIVKIVEDIASVTVVIVSAVVAFVVRIHQIAFAKKITLTWAMYSKKRQFLKKSNY
jgi:hypothetical protein